MRALLWISIVLIVSAAAAKENIPLYYSRTDIAIISKTPAAPTLPWLPAAAATEHRFDVEVRDGTSMRLQGWFNLAEFPQNTGMMLAYPEPLRIRLTRMNQYVPLDVLLIGQDGTVQQIFPKLVFSDLKENVDVEKPVLAVLYLNGGVTESLNIRPGDEVVYKIFHKADVTVTPGGVEIISGMPKSPDPASPSADHLMQQILEQDKRLQTK